MSMRKTARHLFAAVAAIVMALVIATPAYAAKGPSQYRIGSITISDATPGENYKIWQILYLDDVDEATGEGRYKYNGVSWDNWLVADGAAYVDYGTYVSWKDGADMDAAAKSAYARAQSQGIATDGTAEAAEGESSVTFDKLHLGYYLVASDSGCGIYLIDTNNPDLTIGGEQAPTSGSITINNAVPGATYSIYRIFDLDLETGDYTARKQWMTWSNTYYTADRDNGYKVTWNAGLDDATMAEFAADALHYAKEVAPAPIVTPDESKVAEGTTVTFDDLPFGYYLIDSSVGAVASLDTVNADVTIEEKNDQPTLVKEIVGQEEKQPSVGDVVDYQVTITYQPAESKGFYIMHDTMTEGLTPVVDSSGKVAVNVSVNGEQKTTSSGYSVSTPGNNCEDGCTFEIVFSKPFLEDLSAGDAIVVTYQATVNDAAVADGADTNTAYLSYGDSREHSTVPSSVETDVFSIDLVKTDEEGKLLDGAEFSLYDDAEGGEAIALVKTDNGYRVAMEDEESTTTIAVTDGKVTIDGLGSGTYYLEETKAPENYDQLDERVEFTIGTADNAASVSGGAYQSGGVQVENVASSIILPGTGGMGTTVIYVVSAVVLACAGTLLVIRRRRMSASA